MKKVVVINGSPSPKGYTMKMVKIFEEQSKVINPFIDFEYIHLIEKDLKYCLGCCRCLAVGGHLCPIEDDAAEILDAMCNADGVVFAAPGYSQMVSGLYKNFMDRFMYLDHIPDVDLIGKPALVISTSGAEMVMKPAKFMSDMGALFWGCNVTDVIGIASAMFVASEKYAQKTEKKLFEAAEKFSDALFRVERPRPSFKQYMYFMFNKTENEIGEDNQPYRIKYWNINGWMEADYYYETFVNPLYKLVGGIVFPTMKMVYRLTMGKNAKQKIRKYLEERY